MPSHPDGTGPYPCCCPFTGSPSTKIKAYYLSRSQSQKTKKEIHIKNGNMDDVNLIRKSLAQIYFIFLFFFLTVTNTLCIKQCVSFLVRSYWSCNLKRLQTIPAVQRHQVLNYEFQPVLPPWRPFAGRYESTAGEDVQGNSVAQKNCSSTERCYLYSLPFNLTVGQALRKHDVNKLQLHLAGVFSFQIFLSISLFCNTKQECNFKRQY